MATAEDFKQLTIKEMFENLRLRLRSTGLWVEKRKMGDACRDSPEGFYCVWYHNTVKEWKRRGFIIHRYSEDTARKALMGLDGVLREKELELEEEKKSGKPPPYSEISI